MVLICFFRHNEAMSLHSALEKIVKTRGTEYITGYFDRGISGAQFNSFRSDPEASNRIPLADLDSVNLLALSVPWAAGLAILGTNADRITDLLTQIPDRPLGTLEKPEFEKHLGPKSAAMDLWRLLRGKGRREYDGMGPARVSKLMARKRPHLIPIRDSIVVRVAGFKDRDNDWELWWQTLRENEELESQAERLRQAAKQPELSTLRVFDILLWYHGKYGTDAKNSTL